MVSAYSGKMSVHKYEREKIMTDDNVFSGGGLWLFAILALMWGGGGFGFGGNNASVALRKV